ncbi:hypothetical protein K3727_05195 [Rhodobacteraceae bacterium M382]|nr:hypothetical protein K3727_05195 [Rhodobacteraceae bacterium M382]
MPVLLLVLLLGVFAYFVWRARTTTLTRDCRWRQVSRDGAWQCSFCGSKMQGENMPTACQKGGR